MRATTTSMVDQAPTMSLARMAPILSMAAPATTAPSSGSMAAMATTFSMATPATTFSMARRAMTCASAARALTWQPLTASKRFQLRGPRRLAAEHPPPPRAPFCGRSRLRGCLGVRDGIGGCLGRFWRIYGSKEGWFTTMAHYRKLVRSVWFQSTLWGVHLAQGTAGYCVFTQRQISLRGDLRTELRRTPCMRTSENAQNANFACTRFSEVRFRRASYVCARTRKAKPREEGN